MKLEFLRHESEPLPAVHKIQVRQFGIKQVVRVRTHANGDL